MLGIKDNFLNQIRGIYEKPLDRIILDSEILSPQLGLVLTERWPLSLFSNLFCGSLASELRGDESH